jgi:hypothetical protein
VKTKVKQKDHRQMTARRDPVPEPGPAMRVLPVKWQRAVESLFLTDGDQTKALRLAGYEGKPASMNVMASRIFADDRVRLAVREECNRRIETYEPELISVTRHIMHDMSEKAADRLRAVGMLWDRANPVMTRHRIEVEHHVTDAERDIQHWRALKKLGATSEAFLDRFGPNGVARVEALVLAEEARRREIETPVIDAEYEVLTDE